MGGGIAGMATANALVSRASGEINVTVVTKDPFYIAGPSRPLLLRGSRGTRESLEAMGPQSVMASMLGSE